MPHSNEGWADGRVATGWYPFYWGTLFLTRFPANLCNNTPLRGGALGEKDLLLPVGVTVQPLSKGKEHVLTASAAFRTSVTIGPVKMVTADVVQPHSYAQVGVGISRSHLSRLSMAASPCNRSPGYPELGSCLACFLTCRNTPCRSVSRFSLRLHFDCLPLFVRCKYMRSSGCGNARK